MTIVMGFDQHREQITWDALDSSTGELRRGRIRPADRESFRHFLRQFDGERLEAALEGTTGWRFMVEELRAVGAEVQLAEPAETRALRGPKRRAKTDRAGAKHLRELLGQGRVPVGAWPRQSPRWVAEHSNRPTTVSSSAISSTSFICMSGNAVRKLPNQSREVGHLGCKELIDQFVVFAVDGLVDEALHGLFVVGHGRGYASPWFPRSRRCECAVEQPRGGGCKPRRWLSLRLGGAAAQNVCRAEPEAHAARGSNQSCRLLLSGLRSLSSPMRQFGREFSGQSPCRRAG